MLADPAERAGVVNVISVSVFVRIGRDTPPMVTDVAPAKFTPVSVTGVPPAIGPSAEGPTVKIVGKLVYV